MKSLKANVNTSSRRAVTDALLEIAERDESVVLVSSDSVGVIKAQDFAKKYPDRVIEMGISEQAAVDCSAGLSSTGIKPIYVTYSVFASMRACEQLRSIVCYSNLDMVIVGANGGMGSGEREGVSHQGCEDIGILRTMPGMTILVPSDAGQVKKAILKAVDIPGPVYVRTGSGKEPLYHDISTPFEFHKIRELKDYGDEILLVGCGFVLPILEKACIMLKNLGYKVKAVEISTLKPLPVEELINLLNTASAVVTVEDHTVIGGLGSAVAEVNVQGPNVPMQMVGIQDVFPESGTSEELFQKYGITAEEIVKKAKKALENKKIYKEL
ncbi:MAG: transketolase [Spirochaetia bacterium]|nr:transketolase [Spirochaetia bacterium]